MASMKTLREQLERARQSGDDRAIANSAYKLGDLCREKGKLEEALPLLEESLDLCTRRGNTEGEATVLLSLAEYHLQTGNASGDAVPCAQKARQIYRNTEDPKGLVSACLLLGDAWWQQEDPASALPFYQEALGVCKIHEDNLGTATLLDRTAKMHRLLSDQENAFLCFKEALDYWHKLTIPDRQAITLTNLGDIHKQKGEIQQAILCHESALSIYHVLHNQQATQALTRELDRLRERQGDGGEDN